MELRELEAFVAVATELHFGRAAARVHLGTPTLSELIRRLEQQLGTCLFTRTTRRVSLTSAGEELLERAKMILDEVTSAESAVRRVAAGEQGTVRVGVSPPVTPILAPHLLAQFSAGAPQVTVDLRRLWLPRLTVALAEGAIDVAITCGLIPEVDGIDSEVFCAEPLLVGLRPDHPLADRPAVELDDLTDQVLGLSPPDLFPAWALSQRQVLDATGINPPTVTLADADLAATRWEEQPQVDWILLIPSLTIGHTNTVVRKVTPLQLVPYTLQWNPRSASTHAIARFVHTALTAELPLGWYTQPAHQGHKAA